RCGRASPWRLHRRESRVAVRIRPHLADDSLAQHEDLMAPVEMRIDHEAISLVADDLGCGLDAVRLGELEHLHHPAAVAAQLARPLPDPDDVRSEHLLERGEVALLDRLAYVHHRRSSL